MSPSFFTSVLNSYLPEPHASLLNGIIFGIPLKSTKLFYIQLQRAGLLHIVVLSGMNITILGGCVASFLHELGKKITIVITICFIILFTVFVGPEPPIVRAAIMGTLSLLATLYGKKNTALISMLVSAIVIACFKPDWISSLSFQLSYGATLGLILFGRARGNKPQSTIRQFLAFVKDDLRTSLSAQVFTAPLIFFSFKQVSLVCPLANLLVSPCIAPLMIFGFIASFFGKIHWALGAPSAYICYGLLSYLVFVVDMLSRLPFAFADFN